MVTAVATVTAAVTAAVASRRAAVADSGTATGASAFTAVGAVRRAAVAVASTAAVGAGIAGFADARVGLRWDRAVSGVAAFVDSIASKLSTCLQEPPSRT